MKLSIVVIVAAVVAWIGLWVSSTGVLVYSADTGVFSTRDCRYLVGVTVEKRLEPLTARCPVLRKLGR